MSFTSGGGTNFVNEYVFNSASFNNISTVGTDTNNNVVIAANTNVIANGDAGLIKTNSSGTVVYARVVNGGGNNGKPPNAIATDPSNNIILAGAAGYVYKYNSSGSLQWVRHFDVDVNQWELLGADCDQDNNIYLCGQHTAPFYDESYLIKIDQSGNLVWQRKFTANKGINLGSLKVSDDGDVLVGGFAREDENSGFFARLPGDGSLTGTYVIDSEGTNITYQPSSISLISRSLSAQSTGISVSGLSTTGYSLGVTNQTINPEILTIG